MNRLFLSAFLAILFAGVCSGAPKPDIVQDLSDWTLDVKLQNPEQILYNVPGQRKPQRYWYIIATVTNNTRDDVEFYPGGELMTDTFEIIAAGRKTPQAVFDKIKKGHQPDFPFLESIEKTDHRILQGKDYTRDFVIIWPDFDPNAKAIDLYIEGFSNETVAVDHPVKKDKNGRPVKVFLRKTLQLSYSIGGDSRFRTDAKMIYKGKDWVMR